MATRRQGDGWVAVLPGPAATVDSNLLDEPSRAATTMSHRAVLLVVLAVTGLLAAAVVTAATEATPSAPRFTAGRSVAAAPSPTSQGILVAPPPPTPQPFALTVTGANGTGTEVTPGLPCAQGGSGSYRHHRYEAPAPVGALGQQPGTVRANVEVHRDGLPPPAIAPSFVAGVESHVTFATARGTVRLPLAGGGCDGDSANTVQFVDDTHVIATGSTGEATGTGAYRDIVLTGGTYQLTAEMAPGADNPWTLTIADGQIAASQPSAQVTVERTYWGNGGLDYVNRIVSADYRVDNVGPGDSFGAVLTAITPAKPGVTPLDIVPRLLGDLAAGSSERFTVRYKLGLLGPCSLVILGCNITATLAGVLPDALDVATPFTAIVPATAPLLPIGQ